MSPRRVTESWRDAWASLSRPPDVGWRSQLVHHGARALVLVLAAVSVPLLFPHAPLPDFALLEEGQLAPKDVIAEISFPVQKSSTQLQTEREEAASGVAPILDLMPTAADSSAAALRTLFARMDSAVATKGVADSTAIRSALEERGITPTAAQLEYLEAAEHRQHLEQAVTSAFHQLLPEGVISTEELQDLSAGQVVIRGPGGQRILAKDSLVTRGRFYAQAMSMAPPELAVPGLQLYQALLVHFTVPSLSLNREATGEARQQARNAVATTSGMVLQGEKIVSAHERVGHEQVEKLRAYQAELNRLGRAGGMGSFTRGLGGFLYAGLALALLGGVLFFFRPAVYCDMRGFLIVALVPMVVVVLASVIWRTGSSPALIPVAFAALLIGALYDGLLAIVAVVVIGVLLAGQTPFAGLSVPFLLLAGGSAAALGVRGIRRRAESWVLIAWITGGYLAAGTALLLLRTLPIGDLVRTVLWGGVNATASTVFAMGAILPALESWTGIITDQSLLELSDLNRPLLRELSRRAPGTYAHSINVANLAEAACMAIGANALLARVGVYYHDIGKMAQPQYFIENQPKGRNPHDRLRPSRSAEVIREHVREGLHLAAEEGVPEVILAFIREHHGTQTISYFLEKARREEPELDLSPSDFSYPGPKPQSKETAVVMLADAVESATRVLQDPTPERIREVIDRIVASRIEEGQLDQCPLTLRDLDRARSQFARVLIGMYHRRIEYPSTDRRGEGSGDGAGAGREDGAAAAEAEASAHMQS